VRARFSAQIQRRGRSAQGGLSRVQREMEPLFEEDGM
jgi:hypothetical protein